MKYDKNSHRMILTAYPVFQHRFFISSSMLSFIIPTELSRLDISCQASVDWEQIVTPQGYISVESLRLGVTELSDLIHQLITKK